MGFAPDGLYSFERIDGTGFDGLVRVSDGGITFDRVQAGAWINDQDIALHFIDPGSTFLEPVEGAVLRELADRYVVALPPQDPDPSFASPRRPTAR